MKWMRDQYLDYMTLKKVDRQMFVELFGLLIGLDDEWKEQGASEEELNLTGFAFDYVYRIDCGGYTGILNGFKKEIIEETDEYIIGIDEYGRKTKLCKGFATIPLPFDHPVTDMESWLKLKPMFEYCDDRIDWMQVESAKKARENGALVCASIPGGFDLPRQLLGEESVCLAYYDQPELIIDILNTVKDTAIKVYGQISEHVIIDHLDIHEDMAGKCQPLVGPNIVTTFLKPYYRSIYDFMSARGTKLFCQDSDGNMNSIMDAFIDCGVNVFYPCEPAAGMDIVKLRKKYGKTIAFKGGINKHVLRESKEAIQKELEYKLQDIMQEGGVVFGNDHRIPNGTPLENYRYYVETARELLGLPPVEEERKGWERMAF